MPGLDPGIQAERKIDAEYKLICGTPHWIPQLVGNGLAPKIRVALRAAIRL